jgi:hypothetical protein
LEPQKIDQGKAHRSGTQRSDAEKIPTSQPVAKLHALLAFELQHGSGSRNAILQNDDASILAGACLDAIENLV